MIIGMKKTVNVDVKTIDMYLKVCDEMHFLLKDAQGDTVVNYEGYVPHTLIPGEYSEYMHLIIDIETGQITNWKVPGRLDIESFISEFSED
jgi:hypothetical protein